MAVNHVVLSSQLETKLNDHNEELLERFNLAETVFSSSSIPIIRKEEIIVEWLAGKILEVGLEGLALPYEVLSNCVTGPRLACITLEFRRNVVVALVDALTTPLKETSTNVEEKRKQCIVSVLSSSYFLNIFNRDVSSLSKLVVEYCLCCENTTTNAEELINIACIVSNFSKLCLLHEELRFIFITDMMVPLCKTLSKMTDDHSACENEIYSCINQILFREANLTDKLIELFHTRKDHVDESFTAKLIKILKKLPNNQNVIVVSIVYKLFLKAVMSNNHDNHSKVFKVFTLLCKALGIKIKGMSSIGQRPLKHWSREDSFIVITSMVQLVDHMKLSIDCTIENETTLQVWFTSMIIGLAAINNEDLTVEFLKMVTAVIKFNPMVIESAHKPLVTHIMMTKKANDLVKKEYVIFLKSVLDGSLQVSRLQKFISKFLSNVEESLQFSKTLSYGVEDIFPEEITDHFSTTLSMMPGSQVLTATKSLQYHLFYLTTKKIAVGDTGCDTILSTEIVTYLLSIFLNGVKIADFNTPTVVKDKFKNIVMEIGESLQSFSEILIDETEPNDKLLSCFLKLCYCVGSSILLMWEYDRDERRALETVDYIPTNLCFVHSYVSTFAWECVTKFVQSSESDAVKNNFHMLIMQKMTAVSQIEEGSDGPGSLAARYLLANAGPSWLWDNVTALAPLLEDNELLGLLESLIKSAGLDHSKWIPFVSSESFSRNKRLVVAASSALLTALSWHIHKNRKNGAVSYRVMSKVAIVPLLEYELSRLFEDNEELESDVRCFFGEMIAELESYLLEDPPPASSNEDFSIGGFIQLITKISYEDCSHALEVCLLIGIISLLCDIPIDTNNDLLLLEKLNDFLKEPKHSVPAFLLNLHCGALLRFLVKRTAHFPDQKLLIQRFCNFSATGSYSSSYSNHILIKYVKTPNVSTLWQTSAVIKAISEHSNDYGSEVKKNKSLFKLLHATVPLLEKEEASVELLPDYFITLKQVIKLFDHKILSKLLNNFKQYLSIAVSNFDEGKPLIKLALKKKTLLSNEFYDSFLLDLWEKVFQVRDIDDSNVFNHFCGCLSLDELKIVLTHLHTMMEEGVNSTPVAEDKIKRCLLLWKGVIWADLDNKEKKEISQALDQLMTPIMKLVSSWTQQSGNAVVPVLDFLCEMWQCLSLQTLGSYLLDTYLIILGAVPLEGPSTLDHLNSGLDALLAFFVFRRSLVLDRLPPFLQIYRLYAKTLGRISTPDLEEPFLFKTESCADRLSRGTEAMIKHKKDFIRVAPYVISDLLSIFETFSIHPEVKVHFVNTLSSFFSILDEHGKSFLATSLNPACQELYKTHLDQYCSTKYQGKI